MDNELLREINSLLYDYDPYGYMDAYEDSDEGEEDILRMYEDGTLYEVIENIMDDDELFANRCISILKRI